MAPRLRKDFFFVDRKAKKGDFHQELKEKVSKIKAKPIKPICPKKATHFKVEKVKLKSVVERKLQPTPPKQKNMFEKMVEEGIAFRNAKTAKKSEKSTTDIDYASLQIKKIHGATNSYGKLQFLVEWENSNNCDLIDAAVINKHFAQEIIKFYEQRSKLQ